MSLIDFAPWEYETPEQKQEREQRKFRAAVEPVWSDFRQQEQDAEVGRFRDLIQPHIQAAQQEDEVQKFRDMVQPTVDQFAPSQSPTGMFSDRFGEVNKFREMVKNRFQAPEGQPSPSTVQPGYERTATGVQPMSPERLQELNPPIDPNAGGLFQSFLPEESNPLRHIPLVGDEAARVTSAMLSPAGIAASGLGLTSPAALGALAAGTAGSIGLGAAGQGLESLGVPGVDTPIGEIGPREVGEVFGGFLGPSQVRAGVSAAAKPFARGLEEQGGVAGLGKRVLTEETGGSKLGGDIPEPSATPEDFGITQNPLESGIAKFISAAKVQRQNIAVTEAERSLQRSQRLAASESAYEEALAQGASRAEALAKKRAMQSGEYAKVAGVGVDLTAGEAEAMNQRIDTFDFGRGVGPDFERDNARAALLKLGSGERLQENELKTLEKPFGHDFADAIRKNQNRLTTDIGGLIGEVPGLPKAILSSFDESYPLRQGAMLGISHPVEAAPAVGTMTRALLSPKVARAVDSALANDDRVIQVLTGSGLQDMTLGEIRQSTGLLRSLEMGLTSSEEVFRKSLAERIPGLGAVVRASNRAFVTYGNKLRSDVQATILDNWVKAGKTVTPDRLEALSNYLNRFSGRGTLQGTVRIPGTSVGVSVGSNKITDVMQATWWAPQYRISPVQAVAQLFHADPLIRQQAARDLGIFFGTGAAVLGMAKASGVGDVNLNPTSADFGKVRIGNTRINFFGTAQVLARSVAKLVTGDLAGAARYLESGLAPEWSLLYQIYKGSNYLGQPMHWDLDTFKREAGQRLIPLAMQDIKDAIQEAAHQPTALKTAVAAASIPFALLGGTESTYQSQGENFRDAFKKATGHDYNAQAGDRMLAEADPRLRPLLDRWNQEQLGRGADSAVQGQERQAFLADYEKQLGLPEMAQQVLRGNKAVMSQFAKGFDDYQTAAAVAAARDMFGVDVQKSDDPRAVLFREWANIKPNSYRDPMTGDPNWDNYYKDKEAALQKLDPKLQSVIETRLRSADSQVQQVEAQLKQARNDARAYWSIPKYRGLTTEESEHVDTARQAIDYMMTTRAPYSERRQVILGLSDKERRVYYAVKGGSTYIQDPARDNYLKRHLDLANFGLVSLSTLTRKDRRALPVEVLTGSMSPGAREVAGVR